MTLFHHLRWFFRQHIGTYLLALAMLLIVALLNISVPYLIGQVMDGLIEDPQAFGWDQGFLPMLLGIGVALYLLRFGWRVVLFGASYRLGGELRLRFYRRLTGQGQAFFSSHSTGDLMARATNDVDAVEMAAGEGILSGFDGLLTFALILLMMLTLIDWRLTLVALLPFPFMGLAFYRISRRLHRHFHQSLERFSELNETTQQAIAGIRLVKAMGRETVESRQFDRITDQAADKTYQVAKSEAMYDPAIFISLALATALTLGFGTVLIQAGELTIGQLTAFSLYLGQLIWPMFAFGWLLNIVERGSAAIKRLNSLLETPDSVADQGTHTRQGSDLALHNLSFTYPEDQQPALSGLDLSLPESKTIGIAGPTGAGKTTLVRLLLRQFDCGDAITLQGRPLSDYPLSQLRSAYALVPQDPFLFSTTIAENIALAEPEADQSRIGQAAALAAVEQDILRFPEGYQTMVGERGVTLSGGQRQRIAIARALLSEAPILILDDALSAVDMETERQILDALAKHRPQQSRIIISHRLSALKDADEILVLNHGQIAERGRHADLVQSDGWYSRMWTYQQMEAELKDVS
ncbi:ABC transporter transmembrane domain-containing protein [Ferrimonas marina]|uniref:Multidrug resistance-like ATP-binding protein MdlA n=1 Tax=Ferrimonas marina TaxID=299255 RepID=A0A1M5NRF5_9GAMM|nr:ABC transporter transmembrane domain-containing protein [Ferrimonas marina]SHG92057.1 ATP-binding cassette, subfamily B [Ferrimonas marina]